MHTSRSIHPVLMLNSLSAKMQSIGEVAERLNAAVSKTVMAKAIGGSNPPLSVDIFASAILDFAEAISVKNHVFCILMRSLKTIF